MLFGANLPIMRMRNLLLSIVLILLNLLLFKTFVFLILN